MRINQMMKKLQRAILTKGLPININTNQFYSEEQNRMITGWILSTPTLQNTKKGWKTKNYEILRSASGIEVIECLSEIWEDVKMWN